MNGNSTPSPGSRPPGVIRADEVYTLPEFKARVGFKNDAALRSARRNGLKVLYAHRHGYVRGADWLDYLESLGTSTEGA